jgi:L-fuconolactonase
MRRQDGDRAVIIDAHVHLWDAAHTPQPWMTPEVEEIARPFGPSDLRPLLERNHVDSVVLVQGASLDSDTDYLLAEAQRQPWIAAVTAWLCLDEPERARTRLEELRVHPKFRAVRHLVHMEDDVHWVVSERVLESISLVETAGVVFEIPVVYPHHFDDVVELAERFPLLAIVVDHLGKPPLGNTRFDDWVAKLGACAERPNVSAKLSGLNTTLERRDWGVGDFVPATSAALETFGPKRLMCGSDWPIALLNGDYDRVWQATLRLVEMLAPGHEEALLGGNAARVYRLSANGG